MCEFPYGSTSSFSCQQQQITHSVICDCSFTEAEKQEKINYAIGEASALLKNAEARAESIELIGKALSSGGGQNAGSLIVAEKYVLAFQNLAKQSNTILLPSDTSNVTSMVTQVTALRNFRRI